MREVAAFAGVSIKTVSRVINGEPGVAIGMAAKVMQAVDQLDYRQDFAASSLRRTHRRSATIGMVLEDLANPFSAAVQRAVENVARERDVLVLAGSSDDDVAKERFDDILLADLLEPAITVIAQDPAMIGQTAANVLFRRLDGDLSPSHHHVIPTRLIERGSGELRP